MGGDRDAEKRAEQERARGAQQAQQATAAGALTAGEKQTEQRGLGLEQFAGGLAQDPSSLYALAKPAVGDLVNQLTQQAMENVVTPTFQRRGLTQSGLALEGGSRAAVQQAIGVSNLVLGEGQNIFGRAAGMGGALGQRTAQARQRGTQATLTGLGLEAGSFGRAGDIEQQGLQGQQAFGQGIGSLVGTLGSAAMLSNPATAGLSPALALALGQGGGGALGSMFGAAAGAGKQAPLNKFFPSLTG